MSLAHKIFLGFQTCLDALDVAEPSSLVDLSTFLSANLDPLTADFPEWLPELLDAPNGPRILRELPSPLFSRVFSTPRAEHPTDQPFYGILALLKAIQVELLSLNSPTQFAQLTDLLAVLLKSPSTNAAIFHAISYDTTRDPGFPSPPSSHNDVLLLDDEGNSEGVAAPRPLPYKQIQRDWFQYALSRYVHVTDAQFTSLINSTFADYVHASPSGLRNPPQPPLCTNSLLSNNLVNSFAEVKFYATQLPAKPTDIPPHVQFPLCTHIQHPLFPITPITPTMRSTPEYYSYFLGVYLLGDRFPQLAAQLQTNTMVSQNYPIQSPTQHASSVMMTHNHHNPVSPLFFKEKFDTLIVALKSTMTSLSFLFLFQIQVLYYRITLLTQPNINSNVNMDLRHASSFLNYSKNHPNNFFSQSFSQPLTNNNNNNNDYDDDRYLTPQRPPMGLLNTGVYAIDPLFYVFLNHDQKPNDSLVSPALVWNPALLLYLHRLSTLSITVPNPNNRQKTNVTIYPPLNTFFLNSIHTSLRGSNTQLHNDMQIYLAYFIEHAYTQYTQSTAATLYQYLYSSWITLLCSDCASTTTGKSFLTSVLLLPFLQLGHHPHLLLKHVLLCSHASLLNPVSLRGKQIEQIFHVSAELAEKVSDIVHRALIPVRIIANSWLMIKSGLKLAFPTPQTDDMINLIYYLGNASISRLGFDQNDFESTFLKPFPPSVLAAQLHPPALHMFPNPLLVENNPTLTKIQSLVADTDGTILYVKFNDDDNNKDHDQDHKSSDHKASTTLTSSAPSSTEFFAMNRTPHWDGVKILEFRNPIAHLTTFDLFNEKATNDIGGVNIDSTELNRFQNKTNGKEIELITAVENTTALRSPAIVTLQKKYSQYLSQLKGVEDDIINNLMKIVLENAYDSSLLDNDTDSSGITCTLQGRELNMASYHNPKATPFKSYQYPSIPSFPDPDSSTIDEKYLFSPPTTNVLPKEESIKYHNEFSAWCIELLLVSSLNIQPFRPIYDPFQPANRLPRRSSGFSPHYTTQLHMHHPHLPHNTLRSSQPYLTSLSNRTITAVNKYVANPTSTAWLRGITRHTSVHANTHADGIDPAQPGPIFDLLLQPIAQFVVQFHENIISLVSQPE